MSEIKVTVKMPSDQKWVLNVEEDLIIEDLKKANGRYVFAH